MIGRTFLDTQNASEIDPLYALADELVVLKRHTLNLVANVSPDHDEIKPHSYIRWNAMTMALRAS